MGLQKGDFVLVNYTISVLEESGERVIDTTIKEEAEKAGFRTENVAFEPELVVVGEGFLLKPVEEKLVEMNEGEKREIVLEPSQAFGERDPKNIRVIPARELSSRGIIPRVGEEIELDGKRGKIIKIGAGRVTIDFNHPFAGKKVKVVLSLEKVLKNEEEKIKVLFRRWFRGIPQDKVNVTKGDGAVRIEVPPSIFLFENSFNLLSGFVRDVEKYFGDIASIELVEKIQLERGEKKEGEAASEATTASGETSSQEAKAEEKAAQ
ncbi:FKBP-type peptidyl-prolyl cis-trans isomerase [Thermofilum pendens]|uniref:Peptidyl-prolyl cis-trans isomerase n=1 Tax=Thermofilum pendens (strain DSM 2475 / Hrk 5) TaxID=368408 RepID=A1RWY5_THEPD|nr:FKBP-type peptidyl-prolyl cis-trans isomerase [Thermofilum pendens]ABL77715.1 peptidylprolyl isomerase, FKBP-type [Thermofilum pendens Hrk 5]